ncbi:MAG: LLM class flavin-dependent oxidoreductase [Chloroflexi bacterium]|nr:LLM class flavin-dependent oxidoreductase [Chloroflexota bacterium]
MKFGFVLPSGDARAAADLARQAEEAGWDGFFVWEPVWGVDAWVALTAAAMVTERIRLGTMLTPISRMRPWKLASETATLDRLSGGRVILSVGLGAPSSGFAMFGEEIDRKRRAELMDEGLEIITRLWRGEPFDYEGRHYQVHVRSFEHGLPPAPLPVQQPRIPIWIVGAWPREKSMQRALRYDGLLPNVMGADGQVRMSPPLPEEIAAMHAYIQARRGETTPYDLIVEGETPGGEPRQAAAKVKPFAQAGATWWIEALWGAPDMESVRRRLLQGPPQI